MSTIYDVAKGAGVSPSTVSRAFNSPGLISHATHRNIMHIAERLDYKPLRSRQRVARGATGSSSRSSLIGFHFFSGEDGDLLQANDFYGNMLAGALQEATESGLQLVLSMSKRDASDPVVIPCFGDSPLESAILVGSANPSRIAQVAARAKRVVLVDARDDRDRWDSVLVDNIGGAEAATRHLIALGHTRIAFVLGHAADLAFQERFEGYLSAHRKANIAVSPDLVIRGTNYSGAPIDQIRSCLTADEPPTAIVTSNDHYAYWVYNVCHALGISIPDDLSVVGFDDSPHCLLTLPPLTTIRVDTMQIGRIAVRRIAELIERADSPDPRAVRIVLTVSLVERGSTGPPRKRSEIQ